MKLMERVYIYLWEDTMHLVNICAEDVKIYHMCVMTHSLRNNGSKILTHSVQLFSILYVDMLINRWYINTGFTFIRWYENRYFISVR
jgi:hypothetical protein